MCGRYVFWNDEPDDELQRIVYDLSEQYPTWTAGENGEIAPTQQAPVLTGPLTVRLFTWGYPAYRGGKVLINARCETAAYKPTFQQSLYRRRCLIVSTGYFEWSAAKTRYLFRKPKGGALYLAGLYENLSPHEGRFVILTTQATGRAGQIHSRMPLLVDEVNRQNWLENTAFAMRYLDAAKTAPEPKLTIESY